MKIGILTLPLHTNYGGNLQAYALMTILKQMGHDVQLVNRQQNKLPKWKYPLVILKRVGFKYVLNKKNVQIFLERQKREEYAIISQNTQPFIEKYITPQTQPFYSTSSLRQEIVNYKFDAIVVGSDQVWRPSYAPNIEDYFLNFLTEDSSVKRISYAPSFGSDNWEFSQEETEVCANALKKFNAISVREKSGLEMCKKHLNVDVTHVLDPTMLLDYTHYLSLIKSDDTVNTNKDLLVYVLDDSTDKDKAIDLIADKFGFSPFRTNGKTENQDASLQEKVAPPIEDWLMGFHKAKYVITDSFHACVFSILFQKPFIVYGNKERGLARFNSLLEMFDLKDRLITSSDSLGVEKLESPIDWGKINKILEKERHKSFQFLTNGLK